MKHIKYDRSADFDYLPLFQREDEIYSEIRKERRARIALLIILFIALAMTAYGILIKDYQNTIPPITVIDQEQMVELQSYHSDKGLAIIDDGYLMIKKCVN